MADKMTITTNYVKPAKMVRYVTPSPTPVLPPLGGQGGDKEGRASATALPPRGGGVAARRVRGLRRGIKQGWSRGAGVRAEGGRPAQDQG